MKYNAKKFGRDMRRIIISAKIGHIWYFEDAHGSSGTMLAFGPTKNSVYYFVDTLSEDRYKVYHMRTMSEILKEVKKDFYKYNRLFPELNIVVPSELLKEKKYEKSVDESIKYFFKRRLKNNLVRREFKNFDKGAALYFKKMETLNKKKLFDLLVTKGKLNMPTFEKLYGSMGDEGEDISERVKHYKHGKWDIYLDVKTKRGVDEVIQLLDDASKDLAKKGYSKLCYGRIIMVDNLGGTILADYSEQDDIMRVGFKMLKKSNAQKQKISFIHEIGHRNYYKFLTPKQRAESDSKFFSEVKLSAPKSSPKSGEVLVSKTYGDRYKVEKLNYKRTLKYQVQLIELGENTKTKSKDLGQKFAIDDKFVGVEFIPEGKEGGENTYVPRVYGMKNAQEFYAVLWETWFQNKLKDPAKSWFENLEK